MDTEVKKQKKLDIVEKRDFRREESPEKYMTKILYGQNNRKFKKRY